MVLERAGVALEVVLVAATREVLKVVLESVELLLRETDAEDKDRLSCKLAEPVAVEMVATPIVILAVETEALRKKSVAKGKGE